MSKTVELPVYTLVLPKKVLNLAIAHHNILGLNERYAIKVLGRLTSVEDKTLDLGDNEAVLAYDLTDELLNLPAVNYLNDPKLDEQLVNQASQGQARALYDGEEFNLGYLDVIETRFLLFIQDYHQHHELGEVTDDFHGMPLTYEQYLGTTDVFETTAYYRDDKGELQADDSVNTSEDVTADDSDESNGTFKTPLPADLVGETNTTPLPLGDDDELKDKPVEGTEPPEGKATSEDDSDMTPEADEVSDDQQPRERVTFSRPQKQDVVILSNVDHLDDMAQQYPELT